MSNPEIREAESLLHLLADRRWTREYADTVVTLADALLRAKRYPQPRTPDAARAVHEMVTGLVESGVARHLIVRAMHEAIGHPETSGLAQPVQGDAA